MRRRCVKVVACKFLNMNADLRYLSREELLQHTLKASVEEELTQLKKNLAEYKANEEEKGLSL